MLIEERRRKTNAAARKWWATRTPEQKKEKNKWGRDYVRRNPAYRLFYAARSRAKEIGVPFTIVKEDIVIPDVCPILGIALKKGDGMWHEGSPTIDRMIPVLGYVPGNITVISHRANRLKSDATAEELESIAKWVRSKCRS